MSIDITHGLGPSITIGRLFAWIGGIVARIFLPFRGLRFKLSVSYTVFTLCMIILLEVALAVIAGCVVFGSSVPDAYAGQANAAARGLQGTLIPSEQGPGFSRVLKYQLDTAYAQNPDPFPLAIMRPKAAIVDARGVVLASAPGVPFRNGEPLSLQLSPEDANPARMVLDPRYEYQSAVGLRTSSGSLVAAAPIRDRAGHLVGAVYLRSVERLDLNAYVQGCCIVIPVVSLLFGALTAMAGLVFGAVTGRPLARRLNSMSSSLDSWGQGHFASQIRDRSGDEIGRLGKRFNALAAELPRHVAARQKLATLEERNRLARNLHDTVKQQAFAAAMQLGAARTVLAGSDSPASHFVEQAEKLTNQVQEDLTTIIYGHLYPDKTSADNRDMSALLTDTVADWALITGIAADVAVPDKVAMRAESKRELLLIVNEALTNIARHSNASDVRVALRRSNERLLELTVSDNGCGFDAVFSSHGMGLYSMRDRACSLPDGTFQIETAPGKGTTIRISWTMEAESSV